MPKLFSARLFQAGGFTRGELSLMASAAMVGAGVGYLLLSDFTLIQGSFRAKGEAIGEIVKLENNVKRRPADLPLWATASKNQPLYQKDQIYTDKGSRAQVSFGSAGNIDVEENALVVLEKRENQTTLDVQKGSVIARVSDKTSRGIQVSVGGKKAVLSGTNLTAVIGKDSKGQTKVAVLEGQGQLSVNGSSVQLKQNQEASIEKNGSTPVLKQLPDIKLKSMNEGEALLAPEGSVTLSWDAKNRPASVYRVQLAKELSFANPVSDSQVSTNQLTLKPSSEGRYYWRVGVMEKDSGSWTYSAPALQSVSYIVSPQLLFPRPNQALESDAANGNVKTYLDWQAQPTASAYVVQLALDPNFKDLIINKKTSITPMQTGPLPAGAFYWRVQTVYPNGSTSKWSPHSVFSVGTEKQGQLSADTTTAAASLPGTLPTLNGQASVAKPTPAPTALAELGVATLSASATDLLKKSEDPPVTLSWTKVDQAQTYLLQIATNAQFEPLLSQKQLSSTDYKMTLGIGTFHARVAAQSGLNRTGPWSQTLRISVKGITALSAAVHTEPSEGAQFAYRTLQPDIKFAWEDVPGAEVYKLEIAEDAQFKKITRVLKANRPSATVALNPGKYFWRVASEAPASSQKTYSQASDLTVVQQQVSIPILRMPTEGMTVDFDQDEDRNLQFLWDNPPGIQDIHIVIGRDQKFTNLVGRLATTSNSISLQIKSNGVYYWFVEGRDKKERTALRSKISTFNVVTTPVAIEKSARERLRVEFGYNPSTESYSHKDNKGVSDSYKATFTNTYQVALRGWLSSGFGIDAEFKKRTASLSVKGGTLNEKFPVSADLIDASGVLRYKVELFKKSFPIDLGMRVGYSFDQVQTFYSETADNGTIDDARIVRRSSTHHLVTGIETQVPIGGTVSLEANFDYLHLLSSYPIDANSSKFYATNINFLYQFLKHGIIGYGLFFKSMEATYTETEINSQGSFKTTTYGMLYSFGWVF